MNFKFSPPNQVQPDPGNRVDWPGRPTETCLPMPRKHEICMYTYTKYKATLLHNLTSSCLVNLGNFYGLLSNFDRGSVSEFGINT